MGGPNKACSFKLFLGLFYTYIALNPYIDESRIIFAHNIYLPLFFFWCKLGACTLEHERHIEVFGHIHHFCYMNLSDRNNIVVTTFYIHSYASTPERMLRHWKIFPSRSR